MGILVRGFIPLFKIYQWKNLNIYKYDIIYKEINRITNLVLYG